MWGEDRLTALADDALTTGEAVEVVLSRTDSALTRFAGSRIHQNTSRLDGEARVRVVREGRVGVVVTNELTADAVRAAAVRAGEIAALTPPDPHFPGLTPPGQPYGRTSGPDEETVGCAPQRRAELVAAALDELPAGVEAAGTMETSVQERAVVSSTGVRVYSAGTRAAASVLAQGPTSSGWAEAGATSIGSLDCAALGRRAGEKVLLGANPQEIAAGRYPVVLESGATTNIVQWLGWLAFPGRAYNEERSALSGRLGQQVCSPLVTIVDDALSPLLPGAPFDAEGTATRRTSLIEAGVAVGIAHDRTTGALSGTGSTGHAMPAPNPHGGVPAHLLMNPGTESIEELVAGLERGLYVTRFHYTNVVHPVETSITGMTRDGTFLVEGGKVVGGVRNLRFTQSCLDALAGCEAVGSELELATDLFYGASMAPAVRLTGFTFTSTTAY
ncbi:MAG: PmbA protein [Actinomycetota bacterium]|jgi:predicted Zn-dependent protease|nr:PmbA protein [Actinomycetota bacterium]